MLDTELKNTWNEKVFKAYYLKTPVFFLVSNIYYFFSFCYLSYGDVFLKEFSSHLELLLHQKLVSINVNTTDWNQINNFHFYC